MKTINLKIIFAGFIVGSILFFGSCTKKGLEKEEFGSFSKEITITDENGNNQMVLKISANEDNIIDYYSDENFEIIPVLQEQTISDANELFMKNHPEYVKVEADLKNSNKNSNEDSYSVSIEILEKNKQDGVKSLTIFNKPPEIPGKGWSYQYYYSQKDIDKTFHISRGGAWRKVYFGLKYKAYSNSSWSTTISEWRKINRNSSYEKSYGTCHQIRAHVKFKKSSHFTVNFTE